MFATTKGICVLAQELERKADAAYAEGLKSQKMGDDAYAEIQYMAAQSYTDAASELWKVYRRTGHAKMRMLEWRIRGIFCKNPVQLTL